MFTSEFVCEGKGRHVWSLGCMHDAGGGQGGRGFRGIVLLLGKLGTKGGVWFVWRMFFFATGWYVATLMEYVAMLQELQGRN